MHKAPPRIQAQSLKNNGRVYIFKKIFDRKRSRTDHIEVRRRRITLISVADENSGVSVR